jgi:hypothetical protein
MGQTITNMSKQVRLKIDAYSSWGLSALNLWQMNAQSKDIRMHVD